jgi:hypothetical protein
MYVYHIWLHLIKAFANADGDPEACCKRFGRLGAEESQAIAG